MSDKTNKNPLLTALKWKRFFFLLLLLLLTFGATFFYLKDEKAQNQTFDLIQKIKNHPFSTPSSTPLSVSNKEASYSPLISLLPKDTSSKSMPSISDTTVLGNNITETPKDESAPSFQDNKETAVEDTSSKTISDDLIKETEKENVFIQDKNHSVTSLPEQSQTFYNHRSLLIHLRDDFLFAHSCSHSFQAAMIELKPEEATKIAQFLSVFCQNNASPTQELDALFKKSKTNALKLLYRELDPSWKGYIKSIFLSLVQIRNLNPIKENVENILDHAHLALERKQIEKSLSFIQKLPPLTQQAMAPYIQLAEQYLRAKKTLDELILNEGV